MNTNGHAEQVHGAGTQEPRLPQIDPVTFSALTMIDGFVARAALTRQEHAEANRSLQHLVQTIETLQARVQELARPPGGVTNGLKAHEALAGGSREDRPAGGTGKMVAAAAEEMFRNSRKE